jgi:hypothetical protein
MQLLTEPQCRGTWHLRGKKDGLGATGAYSSAAAVDVGIFRAGLLRLPEAWVPILHAVNFGYTDAEVATSTSAP